MRLTAPLRPSDERKARELFGDRPLDDVLRSVVPAEECFSIALSAGMLFGLTLADGLACRAQGDAAAARARRRRRGSGAPPPPRLPLSAAAAGAVRLGAGYAVVHEWIEKPQRDLRDPGRRREAARLLAKLVALAPRVEGLPPTLAGPRTPFPAAHDSRFDMKRPDGRWIDEAQSGC